MTNSLSVCCAHSIMNSLHTDGDSMHVLLLLLLRHHRPFVVGGYNVIFWQPSIFFRSLHHPCIHVCVCVPPPREILSPFKSGSVGRRSRRRRAVAGQFCVCSLRLVTEREMRRPSSPQATAPVVGRELRERIEDFENGQVGPCRVHRDRHLGRFVTVLALLKKCRHE